MKTLNFSDKLLSIKDVSEMLNLSEATVKRYIYDKKIPSVKVGNARRIKVEDVKSFANSSKKRKEIIKQNDLKIIPGYMGIKTQILDHIHLEINKIAKKGDIILDIFAGSGVVGYELKKDFTIYSNDIETYAYVINKLLIDNTVTKNDIEKFDLKQFEKHYQKNLSAETSHNFNEYRKDHTLFPYILFASYFAGTYFGKQQTKQIDSLRYAIDQSSPKFKNLLLSCLIFACYQTVSSVGSHFAQPKVSREKNKSAIDKKRGQDVYSFFLRKLEDIKENLYVDKKKNKVFCKGFESLLGEDMKDELKNTSVTYIDPPYTIDHYSRFYHILNTLVLYDYPEKIGNGLYRTDRYQSKFCIKSTALKEFDSLVKGLSELGSKIVMSYSDSYRSLMTTDEIVEILKKYYKPKSVKTPIKIEYSYSGFGRSSFNKANELLFIATEPK